MNAMVIETSNRPVVVVERAWRTFQADRAPVRALRGVDFTVDTGEMVAVVGPSGAGKSTLLNVIAGIDVPDEGTVAIDGEAMPADDDDRRAALRRHRIGMVFQFFSLLDDMTALENVMLPVVMTGSGGRAAERRGREVLDLLGIGDRAGDRPPVLSGGQRQRLAIARALANRPAVLLADEPTGALDGDSGGEVLELFRRLHHDGQTIVVVTHSDEVAAGADRIVRMRDGSIRDG